MRILAGVGEMDGVVATVERARRGDVDAFGSLYDHYVERVYHFVLTRARGDHSLAEDLTSETFLRALRGICRFEWCGRDAGAWLLTIARNLVYDHFKSSAHRRVVSLSDPPATHVAEGIVDPEDEALRRITYAELHEALRMLTDDQREVLHWRFLQGFSIAETAALMGKNTQSIKALQYRAVCSLRSLLTPAVSAVGA